MLQPSPSQQGYLKSTQTVDTNSASGLEARSYQPESNSHKDSATLVSLKRRGNSGSGSSPSSPSDPQNLVFETVSPFGKAQYSALFFEVVKAFGTDLGDAPKNVKAAGAALSESTGKLLVDFGNKGYSKIKPFLDDASDKLKADVSYNLQQVTAALSNIEKKIDSAKLEVDAVQQAFGRVFKDYQFYIKTLRPYLNKSASGQDTNTNSDILDQDFSWDQIAAALLQMSPRKVPGDNGISTAFYQAVLYMLANTQEGVPPTPFARALLRAGFRKREECVGQVVSLVDIIQRRQNAGLNTHVLFIDIRKAFDTVPVGTLLWKLQNMGFPRCTLAFLKALYTFSSARARAGSLLSDPFPVQRGVRQGCPLSGLLFNLFINDIINGVAPITVPGLPRDTNPIRGLMYADDVAVFSDLSNHCWLRRLLLSNGPIGGKCSLLVSRVKSYKYLGVLIDSKLDHSAWLKQKRSALEHTISALHPVLANHQLTVNYRSCIFSAVVMSKAYYGLELVGGNKLHLAPLQKR
ncbi:hypothetical protein BASA81_002909 [Batrachochytrium salamandrivorans]|nr:hypothetical protein BASA81_002909 [Batrachochytrium salamandrivorans]